MRVVENEAIIEGVGRDNEGRRQAEDYSGKTSRKGRRRDTTTAIKDVMMRRDKLTMKLTCMYDNVVVFFICVFFFG